MAEAIFEQLSKVVIEGDVPKTLELTKDAVKKGISIDEILKNGLIPGIRHVGDLFNKGEYYLPELVVSGKAVQSAVDYLHSINPDFDEEKMSNTGKFLMGTVKDDIHDIGKNIVVMMLKSSGWRVTDLGVDVAPQQFCDEVKNGDYHILGMSVLLTMTMPSAGKTIEALKDAGLRDKIKIIIGGAPVTQEFADEIGADAYGKDGWDAVIKAESLL